MIEGDLIINGNLSVGYIPENQIGLIVLGNLTIKGNYDFDSGCMIVLGDLTIEVDFDNFNEEEFDLDEVEGWLEEDHEVVLEDLIFELIEKMRAGEAVFKLGVLDAFFQ